MAALLRTLAIAAGTGTARIAMADFAYNESLAHSYAHLSAAAYCGVTETKELEAWTCDPHCVKSGIAVEPGKVRVVEYNAFGVLGKSRAVIGKLASHAGCFVAFRGSENPSNWIKNFEVWTVSPPQAGEFPHCDGCKIEQGFLDVWTNLEPKVLSALDEVGCVASGSENIISVTGHSLGAAVAHVAAIPLQVHGYTIQEIYSFETPRIGNRVFAERYHERITSRIPSFRITHDRDPAVHVPFENWGFAHVSGEVFYSYRQGSFEKGYPASYKVCNDADGEDHECSYQFDVYDPLEHCGTGLWPGLNNFFCDACLFLKDNKTDAMMADIVV